MSASAGGRRLAATGGDPVVQLAGPLVDDVRADVGAELKRLAAAGADPAGPEGQAWAARFNGLIGAFTQGDPEIEAGLSNWWQRHNELPEDQQPMRLIYTPEERAFMNAALAAARQE